MSAGRELSASGVRFHIDEEDFYETNAKPDQSRAIARSNVVLTPVPTPISSTHLNTASDSSAPSAAAAASSNGTDEVRSNAAAMASAHKETMSWQKELILSVLYLITLYVFIVALLMGIYYLFAKYRFDEVYAFAIIWLVFVSVLLSGIFYGEHKRGKEEKIRQAQEAADELAKAEALGLAVAVKEQPAH